MWPSTASGGCRSALRGAPLALQRQLDDLHSVALSLNNLGELARRLEDDAGAARLLAEGLALARRLEARRLLPYMLNNLGVLQSRRDDHAAARASFAEALELLRHTGDRGELLTSLLGCALLALQRGRAELAARLLGAVAGLAAAGTPFPAVARADHAALEARAAAELGPQRCRTLADEGRRLSPEQASAAALAG